MSLLDHKTYTFDRVFRLAVTIALLVGTIWVARYLGDVLMPFVVGFLGAYVLHPIVNVIQKQLKNRLLAVAITLLGVFLIITALFAVVVPMITAQMADLARIITATVSASDVPAQISGFVSEAIWQEYVRLLSSAEVLSLLQETDVWQTVWVTLQKIAPGIKGIFSGVLTAIGTVFTLGFILLYLILILLDFDTVSREVERLIPTAWRDSVLGFLREINLAMSVYFRNRFLIAVIQGVLFSIGLTLIGVPLGIPLGMMIGLASMVPYLQTLGIIPALLFGVLGAIDASTNVWWAIALILGLFAIIQVIDDAVLTPRIMGKATGLSPAIILLSLAIWGKLLGLLGLIIAIPMTCVLLAWYKRINS